MTDAQQLPCNIVAELFSITSCGQVLHTTRPQSLMSNPFSGGLHDNRLAHSLRHNLAVPWKRVHQKDYRCAAGGGLLSRESSLTVTHEKSIGRCLSRLACVKA
jgi:hypothetical protein